jgi:hypothetical protein
MTNFLLGMLAGTVGTVLILVAWAWADLKEWREETHQPPWPIIDGERDEDTPYRANVRGTRDGH